MPLLTHASSDIVRGILPSCPPVYVPVLVCPSCLFVALLVRSRWLFLGLLLPVLFACGCPSLCPSLCIRVVFSFVRWFVRLILSILRSLMFCLLSFLALLVCFVCLLSLVCFVCLRFLFLLCLPALFLFFYRTSSGGLCADFGGARAGDSNPSTVYEKDPPSGGGPQPHPTGVLRMVSRKARLREGAHLQGHRVSLLQ